MFGKKKWYIVAMAGSEAPRRIPRYETGDNSRDIFCEIIERRTPAVRIFDTDRASVIMDLNGYPLVLSKTHLEEDVPEILSLAGKMAPVVRRVYVADGVRIQLNLGEAAGQEISHPHVHIIPKRKVEGGVGKTITTTDFGEKSKMARKIRKLCEDLIPYPYKKLTF